MIPIIDKLKQLEIRHQIIILHANESGSRAWGFASPDSDYDVRFIFLHRPERYLSIDPPMENIDLPIEDDLDFSGWELRKALRLMRKSNAGLLEWLHSPIVYMERQHYRQELFNLAREHFNPKAMVHHYLGITKNYLGQISDVKQLKIKKYFYILRPLLAAKWVAEKDLPPPVEFQKLLPLLENEKPVLDRIHRLTAEKKIAAEADLIDHVPEIDDYVQTESDRLDNLAREMEPQKYGSEKLDEYFQQVLKNEFGFSC